MHVKVAGTLYNIRRVSCEWKRAHDNSPHVYQFWMQKCASAKILGDEALHALYSPWTVYAQNMLRYIENYHRKTPRGGYPIVGDYIARNYANSAYVQGMAWKIFNGYLDNCKLNIVKRCANGVGWADENRRLSLYMAITYVDDHGTVLNYTVEMVAIFNGGIIVVSPSENYYISMASIRKVIDTGIKDIYLDLVISFYK